MSHDPSEILVLSDWVYHIENGKIIAEGKAETFFENQNTILITGTVLKIAPNENGFTVFLKIQDSTMVVELSDEKGKALQIGDTIELGSSR